MIRRAVHLSRRQVVIYRFDFARKFSHEIFARTLARTLAIKCRYMIARANTMSLSVGGRWLALVGEAMHIAVLWTRPGLLGRGRRGRVQTRRPRAARRRAAHTSENSWTDRRTGSM